MVGAVGLGWPCCRGGRRGIAGARRLVCAQLPKLHKLMSSLPPRGALGVYGSRPLVSPAPARPCAARRAHVLAATSVAAATGAATSRIHWVPIKPDSTCVDTCLAVGLAAIIGQGSVGERPALCAALHNGTLWHGEAVRVHRCRRRGVQCLCLWLPSTARAPAASRARHRPGRHALWPLTAALRPLTASANAGAERDAPGLGCQLTYATNRTGVWKLEGRTRGYRCGCTLRSSNTVAGDFQWVGGICPTGYLPDRTGACLVIPMFRPRTDVSRLCAH